MSPGKWAALAERSTARGGQQQGCAAAPRASAKLRPPSDSSCGAGLIEMRVAPQPKQEWGSAAQGTVRETFLWHTPTSDGGGRSKGWMEHCKR